MAGTKAGGRPGPRPEQWKTGPDPKRHHHYYRFLRARSQARWRGEQWDLTFEQWLAIWGDRINQTACFITGYMLIRWDWQRPWNTRNCRIMTRTEWRGSDQYKRQRFPHKYQEPAL